MDAGTQVTLGDAEARVTACEPVGADPANVRLTVEKPADFKGGQVVVRAEAGGKHSCYRADLGQRIDAAYFDQTNLPVPDELSNWGAWQLVGFAGDVYCLPRALEQMDSGADDHFPALPSRCAGVGSRCRCPARSRAPWACRTRWWTYRAPRWTARWCYRYPTATRWVSRATQRRVSGSRWGFSFAGDEEHPLPGTLASDGEQVVYLLRWSVRARGRRATTAARTPTALDFAGKRAGGGAARCRTGARVSAGCIRKRDVRRGGRREFGRAMARRGGRRYACHAGRRQACLHAG